MIHNRVMEEGVLGCILTDEKCYSESVRRGVCEDAFFHHNTRAVWRAIRDVEKDGVGIDETTVSEWVLRHKDENGRPYAESVGMVFVLELTKRVESTANFGWWLTTLLETWRNRRLVTACHGVIDAMKSDAVEADDALSALECEIAGREMSEQTTYKGAELWDGVEDWWFQGGSKRDRVYRVGIPSVDDRVSIRGGMLVTVAAKSGMGKSSLVLNVANAVLEDGFGVAVLSLEMGAGEFARRWASQRARVNPRKLDHGVAQDEEKDRIREQLQKLAQYGEKVVIDDGVDRDIHAIRTWCRTLRRENPDIGLFIIDYLQLVRGNGKVSREQQVAEISRGLKLLAKEMKCPVVALSQLNKAFDTPFPSLDNIRESGAVAQDSDIVLFIVPTVKGDSGQLVAGGKMWISVAKQRGGEVCIVPVYFEKNYTCFREHVEGDEGAARQPMAEDAPRKTFRPKKKMLDTHLPYVD